MYNPYSTVILWYFIVLLSTLKQGSANHRLWTKKKHKTACFCKQNFTETHLPSLVYVLSMASFYYSCRVEEL